MNNTRNSVYQIARDFALFTNRSVFLTGKAGSGKTTFLHNLKKETKKQMAVIAPTGVAAINAGGTTIHSFFQLPLTPFLPSDEGKKELISKIKMQSSRRKVIKELELLVIDEISMVRADVMDAIDTLLRHIRYNQEPFGGVQLMFIGDMFQLSPVAIEDEWRILSNYYLSPYFFHSNVIMKQPPVYIELDKIFRQNNPEFIKLLNEVRNNNLSHEGLSLLQSRYQPGFVAPENETWITLTTHNYKADTMNAFELNKLGGNTIKLSAKIEGDYPEKLYPTEKELVLKIGARVMFLKNDTETPRKYFNGKIGIVKTIQNDRITIHCPEEGKTIDLEKYVWENIRYTANEETKKIEETVLGKFTQFPLRLAWAITIHKSQGLTFDKAVIDAGSAFTSGQVYVALSRCRSLEGIILLSQINPTSIQNDQLIVNYERNKQAVTELEDVLHKERLQFSNYILSELFDFRSITSQAEVLIKATGSYASSFNEDTMPFLYSVHDSCVQMQEVADKFRQQLVAILSTQPINESFLSERLTAASAYFKTQCSILAETLIQSPARTDSRTHGNDYTDNLSILFSDIAMKQHLFTQLKGHFSLEDYYLCKNTFLLPEFKINAYTKNDTSTSFKLTYPELYRRLVQVRNRICDPQNLPIYLVAGSQTLHELAEYLPQTTEDILRINGFGPAKAEKYGKEFLDEIAAFCDEKNVSSRMHEFKALKPPKKTKPEKKSKPVAGETYQITLNMYREGKSIAEIAASRNLVESTIVGHLLRFITSGELDIDEFISPDKRKSALELIYKVQEGESMFETLKTVMSEVECRIFISWYRSGGTTNEN